jgi:iron complex outermembrane receptor protein
MPHSWSIIVVATALLAAPPAMTQPDSDSRGALLEELIVTARKREQNLQDVAVGVSLLSGKTIAEAQLRNAADLSRLIPTLNVQASSGPSTSSFNIRGIGTQTLNTSVEPSVSTMLDGVVMGNSGMAFVELVDIERVEVLRGPQGTLYGKNASGGVVHLITRDPTPELSGTIAATAIEDDEYRVDGTLSGPITDRLSYRLTGAMVDDDGYAENVFDGSKVNDEEVYTVRAKLLWQPTSELELLFSADYSERECDCTALAVRSIMPSDEQQRLLEEQLPVVPSDTNQDVNNDQRTISEVDASGVALTVNWELGDFVLTSISAYRDWDSEGTVDFDRGPEPVFGLAFPSLPRTEQEQVSQELRLSSPPADWGNYVVGAYYFTQEHESGNTASAQVIPILPATTRVTQTDVDSDNIALFGEVNFVFAEHWQLTLGGRYTEDELEFQTVAIGTDNLVFGPEGTVADEVKEDDFSPKVALQWDITDSAMTYLSYVEGYKGPAFDTAVLAGGSFADPEHSDAWELGLKSSWLDGRLIVNVAVFHAEYEDFQAQSLLDPDTSDMLPGSLILVNAGEVSTEGVEIEFMARPLDNWSIGGGLAYTDGTIDDYPRGNCSNGQKFRGECPDDFQDLSGGQLPYTPEWKLTLDTEYRIALDAPAEVVLGANLRTQDDVLYELAQDEFTWQDAYTVVDARLALAGTETGYRITAFVKNLFDEDYATLIFANANELQPHAYIHHVPKYADRTWGMELRYDF